MTWIILRFNRTSWSKTCVLYKDLCRYASNNSKKAYSGTVLLPKTTYKSFLEVKDEEEIRLSPDFKDVYIRQEKERKGKELFVLHDGPPYANGDPHLGHSVNKILKDFIVRYNVIQGKRVSYIPGWDCHGLPIEVKAIQGKNNNSEDVVSRRILASSFADEAIRKQSSAFQSWAVSGNWTSPYLTRDIPFVVKELEIFYSLWKKGLVYRDYMPVYWSTCFETALAEAELEYDNHHVSPSIYFKFDLLGGEFNGYKNSSALIWTTTPWTLMSNQAICFAPGESYSLVSLGPSHPDQHFIVASARLEDLTSIFPDIKCILSFPSDELERLQYVHPLRPNQGLPFVSTFLVTMSKGTGLMHSAPNHGKEDYSVAVKNGMKLSPCLVDQKGCFIEDAGPGLAGLFVLNEGSQAVISLLKDNVVHESTLEHSYPCDWRSKKPVVIRPSQQFFLDTDSMKEDCLAALDTVKIYPSNLKKYFRQEIERRPQWCISRQRVWGTPIPVFYHQDDTSKSHPVLNQEILNRVLQVFQTQGINSWWSSSADDFLPQDMKNKNYIKGSDILDIWFDSGVSWSTVLPSDDSVADIYLEGPDQFRGWFQSSLLTRVAYTGRKEAPYKGIFVHGFVLDENGRKMSKSEGNVVDPIDIVKGNKKLKIDAYGSDVLRSWVFRYAAHSRNVFFSLKQMTAAQDDVRKVRTCIRFLLGSLHLFEDKYLIEDEKSLLTTDRMMMTYFQYIFSKCQQFLNDYEFENLQDTLWIFIHEDLSAHYFSAVKNRLYCGSFTSVERRSFQTVVWKLLPLLTQYLTPILPHSFYEAYKHYPVPLKEDNVFMTSWKTMTQVEEEEGLKLLRLYSLLKYLKRKMNQKLPSTHTKPFDVEFILESQDDYSLLQSLTQQETADFLSVASVKITLGQVKEEEEEEFPTTDDTEETKPLIACNVNISRSKNHECPRCRNFVSSSKNEVCNFCQNVLKASQSN